ncbi:MAG TPA: hypothetical protein VJN92_19950 [Candidatus Acidoferrum sp.]|nr:hypothetical protein [Candidatus Acidoferrum sp.]
MIVDGSVGHVAAKDFPKLVLIRASYMRTTHGPLLLLDWQSFPLTDIVLPLLKQQN